MREAEIQAIQRMTNVYYATYANLPSTNIRTGDLGYATDRKVFYRWSGTAWQPVTISSRSGTAANIGTAADYPVGSLYYATDTSVLYQQQAGSWVSISTPSILEAQHDVTGSRALATNYQNTGVVPKLIIATIHISEDSELTAYCDAGTPPTTIVCINGMDYVITKATELFVTFLVPPSYYYKVSITEGGGSPSVAAWIEYY